MVNVGLDFGTTYTSCFYWDGGKHVELLSDKNQPTISLYDGSNLIHGNRAKQYRMRESIARQRRFTGYKILLCETDEKKLNDLGYDAIGGEFCPENITKSYLTDILTKAINRCPGNEKKIGKLVVGVPELWLAPEKSDEALESIEALRKLKTILHELKNEMPNGAIGEIETISEPALACAYYAWKYRENMINAKKISPDFKDETDFNGHMLVIDYGGGTLDINLCKVNQMGDSCEISVQATEGAGKNNLEDEELGKAGFAYMHSVVKHCVENLDISLSEKYEKVQELELELCERKESDLDPKYKSSIGRKRRNELKEEVFIKNFYGDKDLTYGILSDVFEKKISSQALEKNKDAKNAVLDVTLEKIKKTMETIRDKGDKPSDFDDNLKYVLTGGFCNFILTEMAIKNINDIIDDKDPRIKFMDMGHDAKRYSIAYGATLVAEGKIKIRQTYKYSLGIYDPKSQKEWIAFKLGDDWNYNEQMYVKKLGSSKLTTFQLSEIPCIYYDPKGAGKPLRQPPKSEFKRLFELSEEHLTKNYRVGFSLDKEEKITMYLQEVVESNDGPESEFVESGTPITRKLDSIKELFDKIRAIEE